MLIINYAPFVVMVVFFLWALFAFWQKKNFWLLVWLLIGLDLLMAILKSVVQYWVWNQDGLTRTLNNLPLKKLGLGWFTDLPIFTAYKHGYFLYYSWNNFFREAAYTIIAAFIFYFILLALRNYKKSLLSKDEAATGLLFLLLVGWPQAFFFIPLIFIVAVIISLIGLLIKRTAGCGLFLPLIIGAVIVLIFSEQLAALRFALFKF
jgi:hypothetical protein